MSWQQLHLQLPASQVDAISDSLSEMGAAAVTLSDAEDKPIFEPPIGTTPLWDHTQITGLFDTMYEMDKVLSELKNQFGDSAILQWQVEELPEQDWERAWMDDFQPMQFGQNLWIIPSWHEAPDPDAANIELDPGLAFGTGTHPTTALCLEWLDAHPPRGLQAIDFGCGSGILAIAALKLGADRVTGTDIDPQALQASKDNADKNRVSDRLDLYLADKMPDKPVDLLMANILANPLQELSESIAQLVNTGGHIILSGILAEQADAVVETYAQWFEMGPVVQKEDWVRLEGVKK
ncbi:MAG: 50S ribosomal protein L11 methyltransferase [Gammaproteobacteria bacterium]|nr:50S ribosomal protein L11 methyltransferase [Gammaproteobacteria bacterium]